MLLFKRFSAEVEWLKVNKSDVSPKGLNITAWFFFWVMRWTGVNFP
jgi:hypothetical protein